MIDTESICDTFKQRTPRDWANYLYEFLASMFVWTCDFAPEDIFERLLIKGGHCGIFKNGGDPVVAFGGYTGDPGRYGYGEEYLANDYSGNSYRGKVGEDVVVLWNNHTLSGDLPIMMSYAERFVESDKSILNVLRGARITALVTATDNTDSVTLDNVVNAINRGDTVVKVPPVYREIDALDSGVKRFDVLRLTDPKDTDKLQYLTRYRDDLLAAFLAEYGLSVNCVNKMAQVTSSELHSMDGATSAIIESRLRCRERDLDIVRSWGVDISVKPGTGRKERYDNQPIADEEKEAKEDEADA